jgi:hypothetical protein
MLTLEYISNRQDDAEQGEHTANKTTNGGGRWKQKSIHNISDSRHAILTRNENCIIQDRSTHKTRWFDVYSGYALRRRHRKTFCNTYMLLCCPRT